MRRPARRPPGRAPRGARAQRRREDDDAAAPRRRRATDRGSVRIGGIDTASRVRPANGSGCAATSATSRSTPRSWAARRSPVTSSCRSRGARSGGGSGANEPWSALDALGVAHLAGRRACTLSGGEAQRVSLARALVTRPGILLLDEPAAALDVASRARFLADVEVALRDRGTTLVHVSHRPEEALRLADRVAVLVDGTLRQVATPCALVREPLRGDRRAAGGLPERAGRGGGRAGRRTGGGRPACCAAVPTLPGLLSSRRGRAGCCSVRPPPATAPSA